ncbi:MAG: hypothetical protein LC799_10440, partial [Actinobacteria bacterium]|nr:hypothetical protein [Actinomycetota bacterium]
HQTTHAVVRRELRDGLLDAADRAGAGGFGSVVYRAAAALYTLLLEHPVDRRGCCCSCRRPAAVIGRRRRRCRIYPLAQYWLYQPGTAVLVSSLVAELGLSIPSPPITGSGLDRPGVTVTGRAREEPTDRAAPGHLDDTEVLPTFVDDPDDPPTALQSPVVSSPPFLPGGFPRARRPDADHGEAGERPERFRLRRGPSEDADGAEPPPGPGGSLLLTGGVA